MPVLNDVVTGEILTPPPTDVGVQILNTIFPIFNQPNAAIGQNQTIMGDMLSYVTWGLMTVMMMVAIYQLSMRIFSVSETGKFHIKRNGIMPVRIGFLFLLAWPSPTTGFDNAQYLISTAATWGIGLASHAFTYAIQGIGPNAVPIYVPIIPGTQRIIADIVQAELCRSIVNVASNNPNMIPEPAPVTGGGAGGDGYVAWSYALAGGNATGSPACGVVTLHQTAPATNQIADLTGSRASILTGMIRDINAGVQPVVQQFWRTHDSASLAPLQALIGTQANAYTSQLTAAAAQATAALRAASPLDAMRNGSTGQPPGFPIMNQLGWIVAPAWYLEMGRLNGLLLASLVATPTVSRPSFTGLGPLLSNDVALPMTAAIAYMTDVIAYSATGDRTDAPSGYGDLSSTPTGSTDGMGLLQRIALSLGVTDALLRNMVYQLSPISAGISDPFAQLMGIGHFLINTALAMYGLSLILASATASLAVSAWAALTGNLPAAAATAVAHSVFSAISAPLFLGIMMLLGPGLALAFALPLVPSLVWLFGIAGWLSRFIALMYGAPFWMFAHLVMDEEGMVGRGLRGWVEVLALFIYPILMLLGLMSGYVMFSALVWLETLMFYIAANFVFGGGFILTNLLGLCVILCIFVLGVIASAVFSFNLISVIPQKALELLGHGVSTYADSHHLGHDAALIAGGRAMAQISNGVQNLTNGSGPGQQKLSAPSGGGGTDRNVSAATQRRN